MDVQVHKVDIAVDSQSVRATMLSPPTAFPGVLFIHGWGGSQEQDLARAREAAGLGCVCLTFDLRGHERGARQWENVSRADSLLDVVAAYDRLATQRSVDASSIAVVGISYGGYLAALLSSMRPVRWLALRAPALYKDEHWELPKLQLHLDPDLPDYRRRRIPWQENGALRAAATFSGDVLIVESEHDAIVPHPVIENYVAAFSHAHSLTSRTISGADHALTEKAWQKAYTDTLIKWMTEMIVGARSSAAKSKLDVHVPDSADA